MDNLQITLILLALVIIAFLASALMKEKKASRKLQKQLEEINGQTEDEIYGKGKFSELGTLSAGITHEISSPLTIILGRVTRLMRQDFSKLSQEELHKGLEQIKNNAERITAIIQSVREYIYRDEETEEDIIPLSDIIDNVLVFYGQRLKNHDIELRLKDIDTVYIRGHKGQYEQAILNLMSNSFDAIDTLDEKWIEVAARKTDDYVQIFITDSGNGIPVEVRNRMLDPFYSTKKSKGTGLGLTLVKGIAQRHGGDLKYVEAPHTTFVLELPKASTLQYHH